MAMSDITLPLHPKVAYVEFYTRYSVFYHVCLKPEYQALFHEYHIKDQLPMCIFPNEYERAREYSGIHDLWVDEFSILSRLIEHLNLRLIFRSTDDLLLFKLSCQ